MKVGDERKCYLMDVSEKESIKDTKRALKE